MRLTKDGREVGQVKLLETGIPGVLPIVIFVIDDDAIRADIFYNRPEEFKI